MSQYPYPEENDKWIENRLRREIERQPVLLPADFGEQIVARLREEPLAISRFPLWKPLRHIAAVVVVMMGMGYWFLLHQEDSRPVDGVRDGLAVQSATDQFYVLKADSRSGSIIAQNFRDFAINRFATGSTIGAYTLQGVEDNQLHVQEKNGQISWLPIKQINQKATDHLQVEVQGLSKAIATGHFTEDALLRLEKIALYGDPKALEALNALATIDSPIKEKTKAVYQAGMQAQQIRLALQWAQSGAHESRIRAIQSLGKTDSPLAFQHLKYLAADLPEDELAELCLEIILNKRGNNELLPVLAMLARDAKSSKVRMIAQEKLENGHE